MPLIPFVPCTEIAGWPQSVSGVLGHPEDPLPSPSRSISPKLHVMNLNPPDTCFGTCFHRPRLAVTSEVGQGQEDWLVTLPCEDGAYL